MATLKVLSTTDYSAQTLSPLVSAIDFSMSMNFTTATFSGGQFDNAQISQTVQLVGRLGSYSTLAVKNISGNFDASGWTFKDWGGKASISLAGGAGDDTIIGTSKGDGITGGLGTNVLSGGGGNDFIRGFNISNGDDGIDSIAGGEGDDVLVTRGFRDTIDGGAGLDKLIIDSNFFGPSVSIDLSQTVASFGQDSTVTNVDILEFRRGSSADTAIGANGDDNLRGGEGNDELSGTGGGDYLNGEGGNDTISGGDGNDHIIYYIDAGVDVIDGGRGVDLLNVFTGLDGNSDSFNIDIRNGGGGADIGNGTTIAGIERLSVSFDDGNDQFYAVGQDDAAFGDDGNDFLSGGGGIDQLYGEGGDDTIVGGRGGDTLAGGFGIDTISYAGSRAGVAIDILTNTFSGGDADGDRVFDIDAFDSSFENIIGSSYDDQLNGSDLANSIAGGAGDDDLNGRDGDDILSGGAGADELAGGLGSDNLEGGRGADSFALNAIDESASDSQRDMIFGFAQGFDKIDLSAIDAIQPDGLADHAFNFIGRSDFAAAGDLRYVRTSAQTIIYGDVDGDGAADFSIGLKGTFVLTQADFEL